MSLWYKNPSDITFADIDQFCKTMQPEGARLDYKGIAFPKDLSKTIAAFANTLGGLIILGVDADKKTNMPKWPPVVGMPMDAGLSERVVSIAQQAIYPPVRVGVSNVIENDLLPGNALMVIRVNESREAPHATEKNRKVYVYERTDNTNEPYELADMARIEHLIARRQRIVDAREAELQSNLARAERRMHKSITPIRWMSVSPVYPWRDIHDPYNCVSFHRHFPPAIWTDAHWRLQSFTGGSFAIGQMSEQGKPPICTCVSSVSANGTLFCMTYTDETLQNNDTLLKPGGITNEKRQNMWVNLRKFRDMATQFLTTCDKFYMQSKSRPGEVMISVGMKNALDVLMHDSQSAQKSDAPFPDPEFRIDRVVESERILAERMAAITSMFDDIAFAFNANAIPS